MNLRDDYAMLLDELEAISLSHEEVTDTETSDALHQVINFCFVWGRKLDELPRNFRMATRQGDELVLGAITRFLYHIQKSPELASIPLGQARLDFLQQAGVSTRKGEKYDLFIGHRDTPLPPEPLPKDLFTEGEYDQY